MNRRSFLHKMLAVSAAPHFLPGAGRLWKASLLPSRESFELGADPMLVRSFTCAEDPFPLRWNDAYVTSPWVPGGSLEWGLRPADFFASLSDTAFDTHPV